MENQKFVFGGEIGGYGHFLIFWFFFVVTLHFTHLSTIDGISQTSPFRQHRRNLAGNRHDRIPFRWPQGLINSHMDEYKLTTLLVKSILSVISNDPTEICGGIFTGINRVIRATCIIVPVYQNQIEIIDWEQVNYSFQSPVPEQIHEAFVEFLQKLLELDANFNAITANKKVLKLIIDILNMTT